MRLRNKSIMRWLGPATILASLLLTASVAAQTPTTTVFPRPIVGSPEPATLTLLALGGGAAALVRYRKSRRKK